MSRRGLGCVSRAAAPKGLARAEPGRSGKETRPSPAALRARARRVPRPVLAMQNMLQRG
eukprot:CAMPEP_0119077154 /NCGR_PEP_ID=MMETSP1178-20130426/92947_1 /TAXON_ID=33656 /ORGANISM="unid sp, Strain CCMP2000" /LENGTH=58 /DNA_ID=CAMNT_0007059495 /DNA_START=56 /DNA_END=228 /DNA_ORIENTATION=+